jgi:hypothetical protein
MCCCQQSYKQDIIISNEQSTSLKTTYTQCQFFKYGGPNNHSASKINNRMEMKQLCSNATAVALLLLQFQCSSLPTVPISTQQLACCYSFNVAVYLLFQFQCDSLPAITVQCTSSNINAVAYLLLPTYQFTYCSNFNEVACLLLQFQCTSSTTVPISMQ